MNNSFNKTRLSSTAINLSNDYEQRECNLDESISEIECSAIESTQYITNYVSAMRNDNTESVSFCFNVGVTQKSKEIRKLNAILEDNPVMTFVSSAS